MKYLDMNADSYESVYQYYRVRSAELRLYLKGVYKQRSGEYLAKMEDNFGEIWESVYIPLSLRGKGLINNYKGRKFITIDDCGIVDVCEKVGIYYDLREGWYDFEQYKIIKDFYGDAVAERSGEFLMWHITEGCNILEALNASDEAIKAYMLHPKYQNDNDFRKNHLQLWQDCEENDLVLRNIFAYREAANSYLCRPETDSWGIQEISKNCPIMWQDVKDMLIADKRQNYKDFLKYHSRTHPRREQLNKYFNNWLDYLCYLEVTE